MEFLSYLKACPTAFHAAAHTAELLRQAGFSLLPREPQPGGRYYQVLADSTLLAWRLPAHTPEGCILTAAHTDSPSYKLKPGGLRKTADAYLQLQTEGYGGMRHASWMDRPLGIAGRVLLERQGTVVSRLVASPGPAAVIPSVAVHLSRENQFNPAVDLQPLFAMAQSGADLTAQLAQWADARPEEILDHDLYLVCLDEATVWGDFLSGPRLDDLACAYACLRGFLDAPESPALQALCLFDHEEIGSATRQGAGSTALRDALASLCGAMGWDAAALRQGSFLLSADNAHARHPNHPELSDSGNSPVLNQGPVLKYSAPRRYATDGLSAALIRSLCRRQQIPLQVFANRSDLPGGSTLGSIATTLLPVMTVDMGLPQLAMHAAWETMGRQDLDALVRLTTALYGCVLRHGEGGWQLDSI